MVWLSYSLTHISHTQPHTSNGYFKTCVWITAYSLGVLFTQYKTTWLTAISNHCFTASAAKRLRLTASFGKAPTLYTRLLAARFLPGVWPVFCLRLIRATYPEGQSFLLAIALTEQKMAFSGQMFATTPMTQMKMTPTTNYRTYRRTSFFRQRRFLRFWTIKLTFITFACKNQYFVVDGLRSAFTSEKVNWPAAYSWITLDSRHMAKISATASLRMQLISEYIIRYYRNLRWNWRFATKVLLRNKDLSSRIRSQFLPCKGAPTSEPHAPLLQMTPKLWTSLLCSVSEIPASFIVRIKSDNQIELLTSGFLKSFSS